MFFVFVRLQICKHCLWATRSPWCRRRKVMASFPAPHTGHKMSCSSLLRPLPEGLSRRLLTLQTTTATVVGLYTGLGLVSVFIA